MSTMMILKVSENFTKRHLWGIKKNEKWKISNSFDQRHTYIKFSILVSFPKKGKHAHLILINKRVSVCVCFYLWKTFNYYNYNF